MVDCRPDAKQLESDNKTTRKASDSKNQMCVGGMCFPKDLKLTPEKKAAAEDSQPTSDHDGES